MGLGKCGVVRVPGIQEAVTALFDPVVEVGGRDLVGGGKERRIGIEKFDGDSLVDDALAVKLERVGSVGGGELVGLVLDDDVAAAAGEVEEGLRGGAVEVGVGVVGADAEDDGVEGFSLSAVRSETLRMVGVRPMEASAAGTSSPVPGR